MGKFRFCGLILALLVAGFGGVAWGQAAQRIVPLGDEPVLTHAHSCGYSDAVTCYVARQTDGLLGQDLLPDGAARPGRRFAFEHGRMSGGNEYVANGMLISRITRTGPGAYQFEYNFFAPERSEWLEPLRRAEIFYSGRSDYGAVERVLPRQEQTGGAILPPGARVDELVFVGVPTKAVTGLIDAPAALTIDRPLAVRLDRAAALEGAGAFLAVVPVDAYTWSCQPLDRRIVGGIHPLTRLAASRPRLALADGSGILASARGGMVTRGNEAAGGLRSPLIPPLPTGPTIPSLPAAPALPADVLPVTTEYGGPG